MPAASIEIAIGMKTTSLNAVPQRTRSVSTAKIRPSAVDHGRGDHDPDRVVLTAVRMPSSVKIVAVVVQPDEPGAVRVVEAAADGVPDRVDHQRAEQDQRGQQEQHRHPPAGARHALARCAGTGAGTCGRRPAPPSPRRSDTSSRQLVPVRLGGVRLQLRLGARHVRRVLQEVLQVLPLALALGAAEGRRRLVGHVEPEVVARGDQRLGDAALHVVRVRRQVQRLVRREEAALRRPDLAPRRSTPGTSAAPARPCRPSGPPPRHRR